MVPKIHASGGSFRGVMAYCLGDKRIEKPERDDDPSRDPAERERLQREWKEWQRQQAERPQYWAGEVSKRVAWTETLNLDTDKPRQAARRMAATASYSQELKRQAGIPAGGRRLEKPVCHYTLNWKEGETPARREMVKAVQESLEALGMADRQAVVVSHKDGKCAHVHVVVNRVSWEDGRAAKLSRSRKELSKWAERWEKERGEVQCKRRVEHNRIRATGKAVYDRESRIRDQAHHRSPKKVLINRFTMRDGKDEQEARYVARFRVVEHNMAHKAVRWQRYMKANMLDRHRQEWGRLHARQRDEISRTSGLAKRAVGAVVRQIPASREEQAIGRAIGRALSRQLSEAAADRSAASRLDKWHETERRELRERQMGERDALLKRAQVDFYDKFMAKAHQEGYELDRYDERSSRDFERELSRQGFPIHERGQQRGRGREQDIGPSR